MKDIINLLNEVKIVDLLKSVGRIKDYGKIKRLKDNNDLLDLSFYDLLSLCDLLQVEIDELLPALNSQVEIYTIKNHIQNLHNQREILKKSKKLDDTNNTVLPGIPSEKEYCALGYNIGKLHTISRTARMVSKGLSAPYRPTPGETQKTSPRANVPEVRVSANGVLSKAPTVGTPPQPNVNAGYLGKLMDLENIPVRTLDTPDDKNSSVRVPAKTAKNGDTANSGNTAKNSISAENSTNGENIVMPERVNTGRSFDQLSKIPKNFTESANLGVYHNVEEANKIFSRQRKLEKQYKENPDSIKKSILVNARDGVTCYPPMYNRETVSVIDSFVEGDVGEFNVYYSVFNKHGDYLFSEVYSCRYNDGEEKSIKYYKKIFFDVITPGMVFEFTEDDEIPKESFYYGIYRQYRCFGFPV